MAVSKKIKTGTLIIIDMKKDIEYCWLKMTGLTRWPSNA